MNQQPITHHRVFRGGSAINPKNEAAGHLGTVGAAIFFNMIGWGHPVNRIVTKTRAKLDPTCWAQIDNAESA